jgi:F-type H+-transporting ATPase subunit b
MLIDWFTVGAQALNFLILVWLMKRFLYKPVLRAINEREKRIAAELANADTRKAEAKKESDEFRLKNEQFDQQRAGLLSKAKEDAIAEGKRLAEEARKAAAALSLKHQEALETEGHNLHQAIARRTQKEVFAIARKALTDLATTGLEERLSEMFTRRVRGMGAQPKKQLAEAIRTAPGPVILRSAFDLPTAQRAAIQQALNETFSAEVHVQFETSPDLISGIELTANGQKLSWSIAEYLTSMEKSVDDLLKEKDTSESSARKTSVSRSQIAQRAYELYEKHGSKGDSSTQDWSQAEQEIRKAKTSTKPEPKSK